MLLEVSSSKVGVFVQMLCELGEQTPRAILSTTTHSDPSSRKTSFMCLIESIVAEHERVVRLAYEGEAMDRLSERQSGYQSTTEETSRPTGSMVKTDTYGSHLGEGNAPP